MHKHTIKLAAAAMLLVSQPAWSQARVAVAHFAPFADTLEGTAVDIAVNGAVALEGVQFKQFTDYLDFDAGDYTIEIFPVGATEAAISGEFTLMDNTDYTLLAVGNGITQDLDLLALGDNTDDPMTGNLNIRVVHAAPFAADLAATEVSIRTAGR